MPLDDVNLDDYALTDISEPLQSFPADWQGREAVLVFAKSSGQRRRASGLIEIEEGGRRLKLTNSAGKYRLVYPNQVCKFRLVE